MIISMTLQNFQEQKDNSFVKRVVEWFVMLGIESIPPSYNYWDKMLLPLFIKSKDSSCLLNFVKIKSEVSILIGYLIWSGGTVVFML